MNIEKKLIYRISIFSSLIIVAIIGIILYLYLNPKEENLVCGTKSPEFVCGTESTPPEKQEGKRIFNSNCAACHKLNAKCTGPALRAIDSAKYWKVMTQKNVNIDTMKPQQFRIKNHQISFPQLSKVDLESLYSYTR